LANLRGKSIRISRKENLPVTEVEIKEESAVDADDHRIWQTSVDWLANISTIPIKSVPKHWIVFGSGPHFVNISIEIKMQKASGRLFISDDNRLLIGRDILNTLMSMGIEIKNQRNHYNKINVSFSSAPLIKILNSLEIGEDFNLPTNLEDFWDLGQFVGDKPGSCLKEEEEM
jgi:hypothetical protein